MNEFTIHLNQALKITGLGSTILEKGGLVKISGEGFAGNDSMLENQVYFLDKDGSPFSASIVTSSETFISAYVPLGLQFNDSTEPETIHAGRTYTQFWAEPVGRPSHVWRPTASYHFCPDGSFGTACSH